MLTITIDRASLALPALVITGARATTTSGLWIPEGGFGRPGFQPRYTHAPDSRWVTGRALLAVVLEQGTLPLTIRATAATVAALRTKEAELEKALSQFSYPVTVDIDGAAQTWLADFAWPQWATPDAAMRQDRTSRASVVIPVNP